MAKKTEPLSLSDLTRALQESNLTMSAAVAAQLAGQTQQQPAPQASRPAPSATPDMTNGILIELKKLNRSLNTGLAGSVDRMVRSVDRNSAILKTLTSGSSRKTAPPQTKNDLSQQDIEDSDFKKNELKLLQKLVENTAPTKDKSKDDTGIGMWASILAGALGALVGALRGYIKGLKLILEQLLPEKFFAGIRKAFTGIGKWFNVLFEETKADLSKIFKPLGKFFEGAFSKLKGIFAIEEDGAIAKTFKGISKWIGKFTKPFAEAFEIIKVLVSGPVSAIKNIFTGIFEFISKFVKLFKFVGVLVEKIAIPITIIMGIFDTVSGALDGWKNTQGGVIDKLFGALKGGLTGLINGLFGGFADLVKDGVSWVLDFFGAKGAAQWLDSFKFTDIITNVISAMVDGLKDIITAPINVFNAIKDAFNGKIDWVDMIKKSLAYIIKMILAPINTLTRVAGFDISKKALDLLGLPDPGGSTAPATKPIETTKKSTDAVPELVQPSVTPEARTQLDQMNNTPQIAPAPVTRADSVYNKSAENADINNQPITIAPPAIVNAPTTITKQTSNNLMKVNIRNQESSLKNYFRSRFAT